MCQQDLRFIGQRLLATVIALSVPVLAACEQPEPKCATAIGKFTAQYRYVEGSKTGEGTCDELPGAELGVAYYPAQGKDSLPDQDNARLGIQAYDLVGPAFDEANPNVSLGVYDGSGPDEEHMCSVPTLNPSSLQDEEADLDLRYVWSDVRVLVRAGAYGTLFTARLERTENGCTAEYEVEAIFPSVDCGVGVGMPTLTEDGQEEFEEYAPSDDLCTPEAVSAAGYPGFNSAWRMVCEPNLLKCVRASP